MSRRCRKVRRQIDAWPDLKPAEQEALRRHADGCAGCRGELGRALELLARLERGRPSYRGLRFTGELPTPPAAPARRSLWRLLPSPAPAALATLLVVGFVYWSVQDRPAGSKPQGTGAVPGSATVQERATPEPTGSPQARPWAPPKASLAAVAARADRSMRHLRRQRPPALPKRPAGFGFRAPSRPRKTLAGRPGAPTAPPEADGATC